jgi:hypothetical protein
MGGRLGRFARSAAIATCLSSLGRCPRVPQNSEAPRDLPRGFSACGAEISTLAPLARMVRGQAAMKRGESSMPCWISRVSLLASIACLAATACFNTGASREGGNGGSGTGAGTGGSSGTGGSAGTGGGGSNGGVPGTGAGSGRSGGGGGVAGATGKGGGGLPGGLAGAGGGSASGGPCTTDADCAFHSEAACCGRCLAKTDPVPAPIPCGANCGAPPSCLCVEGRCREGFLTSGSSCNSSRSECGRNLLCCRTCSPVGAGCDSPRCEVPVTQGGVPSCQQPP